MSAATATLSNADRCDRCGSRAYFKATLPGGGQLLFCRRDGLANLDALSAAGAEVIDETHTIS